MMTPAQKRTLFANTARAMGDAKMHIKERHIANCAKADPDYGKGVADAIAKDLPNPVAADFDRLGAGASMRVTMRLIRAYELRFFCNQTTRVVIMEIDKSNTAVVFLDPQNDVLSEKGANWAAVGASVTENKTVENMERIFIAARDNGYSVFISPHYFYPTDSAWKFNGPLEADEFRTHTFARSDPLSLTGFENSGADWLDRFKPYIEDGKTIVVSPHKVFGPQTNDLVLQLRKRSMSKIILGGMLANMCVESHLRELLEQGFEVVVVKDAVAGPRHPEWGDGYRAALVNYRFLAHAVLATDDVIAAMR